MKYPPRQGNFLEQQVSISLPHLHSVYSSQVDIMLLQAEVTAMETKTTKRTFIIIPSKIFCLCLCCGVDFNIDTDIICESTYTLCSDNTSEDNKWNLRIIVTVLLWFISSHTLIVPIKCTEYKHFEKSHRNHGSAIYGCYLENILIAAMWLSLL